MLRGQISSAIGKSCVTSIIEIFRDKSISINSLLDPSSRRELIDILLSLKISIILVTHDLPMALEICPRSIVVNGGSITQDGVTKELLTNDKIMKENRLELPFGFALHHLDEE